MRRAEPIAGLGGILLLVSVFLDNGVGRVVDVILALLALLAIAVPVVSLVTRGPAKSIGTAVLASAPASGSRRPPRSRRRSCSRCPGTAPGAARPR